MKNRYINDIKKIRREYINKNTLSQKKLTNEPIELFKIWLNQACKSQISDPTAMYLATIDHLGNPHQRLVLLKKVNKENIIFYTNLNSNKSIQIKNNPRVSVCFPWHALNKQVIMLGYASKLSRIETIKYFYSRPKNSQISTWVSPQSRYIKSKQIITKKFFYLKKKFFKKKVPVPFFWGGYQIHFDSVEFWQGGRHRLHDRFIYKKQGKKWQINRIAP